MDVRQLETELRSQGMSPERLVETLAKLIEENKRLGEENKRLRKELDRLKERLAQYEPEVRFESNPARAASPDVSHYSCDAEEKRRDARRAGKRRKKKSPGRRRTASKFAEAERFESIYPADAKPNDCRRARERAVWRLENGRAVLVGYQIFSGSSGDEPRIPGVTPRCEYGLEIQVVLAYLVYIIGISLDKACAVLRFFCQLPLEKSQADSLLRQLARHWSPEFETLCDLIAHAAVVYMDETGWKVGTERCSVWTFLSDVDRLFVFGCHKDAKTLDSILPREVFKGIGVSDDYAVYGARFAKAQKCWAHLLRKAIRLALLYPRKTSYRRFLDDLLALYRDAKRAAADGRLGPSGRQKRVEQLEERLNEICLPRWRTPTSNTPPHERDFLNLLNELMDLMVEEELFTFVIEPNVEPTNNCAERQQRSTALDRKAGRTSKTAAGARRRSVIMSVLESLRRNLKEFTLASVLAEVGRWMEEGVSLFAQRWEALVNEAKSIAPDTS